MTLKNRAFSFLFVFVLTVGSFAGGLAFASSANVEDTTTAAPVFKSSLEKAKTSFAQQESKPNQLNKTEQVALLYSADLNCPAPTSEEVCTPTAAPVCQTVDRAPECVVPTQSGTTCDGAATCASSTCSTDCPTVSGSTCGGTNGGSTCVVGCTMGFSCPTAISVICGNQTSAQTCVPTASIQTCPYTSLPGCNPKK